MSSNAAESDGVFVLFTLWAPKVMEGWSFSYFGPQKCGSVGRFHTLGPPKGLKNQESAILGYKKAPAGTTMAEKGFNKLKKCNLGVQKSPCGNDNGREGLGTNLVPS